MTAHPSAEWIARQLTEACDWSEPPRYIIRDRDRAYAVPSSDVLEPWAYGIGRFRPGRPGKMDTPKRLVGSIRRDCLDHVVVFGEQHFRHLFSCYQRYYIEVRPHLALNKDAPIPRDIQRAGRVLSLPILGGLHHRYVRI